MKSFVCVLFLSLLLIVACQESMALPVTQETPAPQPQAVVPAPSGHTPMVGVGFCIGRGAGLFGLYAYVRPADVFAIEADFGLRMFIFSGNETEVFWPLMGGLKFQFYFNKRTARFQSGVELGGLAAQDLGFGGEISYIAHFRLVKHLFLEANLGVGYFPNAKEKSIDYLTSVGSHSHYYYENSDVLTTPVMIMWGVGISYMF